MKINSKKSDKTIIKFKPKQVLHQMNTTTRSRIQELKNNGYTLDFGIVFNKAFENYKKIALYGGLMIFVFFVILSLITVGVIIATFGLAVTLDFFKPENLQAESLNLQNLLLFSGVSVLFGALLSPFPAGMIKMAHSAEKDEEFHVSSMFQYYKAPYIGELLVATLVISLISAVIQGVISYLEIPFLGYFVSLIFSTFAVLTVPLIIFGNLKAVEAIEASLLITSKQFFTIMALIFVGNIGILVGLIGCCIGIVFTIPFMYSLYFVLFSEIIGFENEPEVKEIF